MNLGNETVHVKLGLGPTRLGLKHNQTQGLSTDLKHTGVSGPKEAQVVDVLSQKEFNERQSDRCAAC